MQTDEFIHITVLVADNGIQLNIYILTAALNTSPPEETEMSGEELG